MAGPGIDFLSLPFHRPSCPPAYVSLSSQPTQAPTRGDGRWRGGGDGRWRGEGDGGGGREVTGVEEGVEAVQIADPLGDGGADTNRLLMRPLSRLVPPSAQACLPP
ncbi:hypothetical protein NHX12_013583 [Muraenolepis orangiensis]|uniref:Uncharacterized protein n=1 Tax=Muraenolepis orangiensis TaxID=630683 RepID=A0A9Q0I4F8_9TELE|nr:hypothetical protein NHX12_013583 [Muraenolepis orangiensis]